MNCNICGNLMIDAFTTFMVSKDEAVYVVQNVPCLECPICENVSFTQDVANKLEQYCSGRVIPAKTVQAWVYRWGSPIIEIPKAQGEISTENTPISTAFLGTEHDEKTSEYKSFATPSLI